MKSSFPPRSRLERTLNEKHSLASERLCATSSASEGQRQHRVPPRHVPEPCSSQGDRVPAGGGEAWGHPGKTFESFPCGPREVAAPCRPLAPGGRM